jgi:hypothetical protein
MKVEVERNVARAVTMGALHVTQHLNPPMNAL